MELKTKLYARKCSYTGKPMNHGYYLEGKYLIEGETDTEKALVQAILNLHAEQLGFNDWSECHEGDNYKQHESYFTEWEELDKDYWYDDKGKEYQKN